MAMRIRQWVLGLRAAIWLGWQVESNWVDPVLFLTYSVIKPLAQSLVLVFMFFVVAGGRTGPMLTFLIVGSALWPFVVGGLQGLGFTIIEDREEYRMTRYIYTAPTPYLVYLLGRELAKFGAAVMPTLVTLVVGILILRVPIQVTSIHWRLLVPAMLIGLMGIWAVAMMVAALSLNLAQHAWAMPETVGSALYLLCGAIFPLPVLPQPIAFVGSLIPITYWLEAARRALLGAGIGSFPQISDGELMLRLIGSTVGAMMVGYIAFRLGEFRAKNLGLIDAESQS
jgi:ABC-2 type transport system permease protein